MSESAHQRRRRAFAFAAVVTLLGLSALAFFAWSSLGQTATAGISSAAAPANSTPTTGALAGSTPAGSAPATTGVSPLPVGPAALKPSSPPQVAAWNAGPGGATLATITSNLGTVLMAHDAGQFVTMKRDCVSLAADVKAAGAQSAIPDPAMQNLYTKALAAIAAGASDCQQAVSSRQEGDEDLIPQTNSSLLVTAMSQFNTGTRDLYIATAGLKDLRKP